MAKLGVITDGISREFEYALGVMNEFDLSYAELQFVWDKEVGDLSDSELSRVEDLVSAHQVTVSCISRHIFGGLSIGESETDSPAYLDHLDALGRCIDMAQALDCSLVRVMSFRKEMILFGSHGADVWNVSHGAWDKLLQLMERPVQMAEDRDVTLVVETGNNAMVTSAYLGRKLIDDLDTHRLKVLWDPCNSLYCNERPYPDGYEAIRGESLGHIHLKDAEVDIPRATVACKALHKGHMAPYLEGLIRAIRADRYDGVISLESIYRPDEGSFEDGFRESISTLKQFFD
ncbi:MAG: sugar phosphate isomerase/epimerase [bacterium]|nr:sugar phosphate isomerase/epimerase [bacterium]